MPASSPPPPTAARTAVASGAWSSSSVARVPVPSIVSSWSNACTGSASESARHRSLAAYASAYASPVTTSSAPYPRIRSILAGDETVGT
jgi:hypothetical protein